MTILEERASVATPDMQLCGCRAAFRIRQRRLSAGRRRVKAVQMECVNDTAAIGQAEETEQIQVAESLDGFESAESMAAPEVDSEGICSALSDVYSSLCATSATEGTKQRLTCFHSKKEPPIGLQPYLQRMWRYFGCSKSCHVVALIYIDRVLKLHPNFAVTRLSIHRLLAIATVVSAKFMDDIYYSNSYYAKVCGLSLRELNRLEATFIFLIKWEMAVSAEEYATYLKQVRQATSPGGAWKSV